MVEELAFEKAPNMGVSEEMTRGKIIFIYNH